MRLYYTNPIMAVKAANKYEQLGYVVELTVDGDVLVVTVYKMEVAHVA